MVSARSRLIARADSYLPADARPTRKLGASRTTIGGTAIEQSTTARKNLVKRDYDPLAELITMRSCLLPKFEISESEKYRFEDIVVGENVGKVFDKE